MMIPSVAPLGDIASFIRGITFKPEELVKVHSNDSIVCMRTKNIQADLDQADLIAVPPRLVRRNELLLQEGDILISSANSWELVGKCCWVPKLEYAAVAGGFISNIRANRAKVEPRYLYHWLSCGSTQHALRHCGRQTTNISNLNFELASQLTLPVPSLSDQRRIAAILDKADDIRRRREEGIRLTEDLLRSTFLDMFGNPATNPKQWPKQRLGEFISYMTSGSRGWAKYYSDSGTRFIRSLDVQMNTIGDDDPAYVNPPQNSEAIRTQVREDDVLLTITGSKVGRVAFVPVGFGQAHVSQHVAILRLDGNIRPRFVSMFLSDENGGQRQIKMAQYGQTKPGLNLDQIRNFEVLCPPLPQQDRFISLWARQERLHHQKSAALKQSDGLFNSLIQRAFRGEL